MCTVGEMKDRWVSFQETETSIAGSIITENSDSVLDLIRGQLLEGKDGNGDYLYPTYSTDPYFKSTEAATNYAKWKKDLFPGNRPEDVPNLIIRGDFHQAIVLSVSGDQVNYSNTVKFSQSVLEKFGDQILGLMPESKTMAWQGIMRVPFVHALAHATGCEIG